MRRKIKGLNKDFRDVALSLPIGLSLGGILSFLLYDSLWGMILSPVFIFLSYCFLKERRQQKERKELTRDFSTVTATVTGALLAGYSMENAWREAYRELCISGSDRRMCRELGEMMHCLELNEPIENLVSAFAERSGIEDIQSFAEVFSYSKRAGADQVEILERTTGQIREKQEIANEIDVMVSEKKLEQNIMNFVPLGMLLYLRLTADSYISALYHNLSGILIMTACLAAYLGAFYLSVRILKIEV